MDTSQDNSAAAAPEPSAAPQGAETTSSAPPPELDTEGNPIAPEPVEETEELERDGKKYVVPKWLAQERLMQADYTRKAQALADERRQAEEFVRGRAADLQKQQELVQSNRELVASELQLEQYRAISPEQWEQWKAANPSAADTAYMRFQALKDRVADLRSNVEQEQGRRALQEQQQSARRLEQAEAIYKRDIPGWSPAKADELAHFAVKELGASYEQLKGVIGVPWLVKALAKAQAHATYAKTATAPPPTPQAQPSRTIAASNARSTVNPDKLPMSEWMKWQDQEEARKRRRS
jgi:hypothetical protein